MVFAFLSSWALSVLLVLSRKWNFYWKSVWLFCLTLIWGLLAWILLPTETLRAPLTSDWYTTPVKDLILFAAMIAGMAAKYLWDLIEIRRRKNAMLGPKQKKHGLDFDFWDFVQPMLVSACVFSSVLHFSESVSKATILFSFQNGFFWQTVFRKKGSQEVGERVTEGS